MREQAAGRALFVAPSIFRGPAIGITTHGAPFAGVPDRCVHLVPDVPGVHNDREPLRVSAGAGRSLVTALVNGSLRQPLRQSRRHCAGQSDRLSARERLRFQEYQG
ncbi:hypothetical protein GCM10022223_11980 [Kineosporia mesophila]|uniref:Uncharacterized protein n=1 Tax=Kineosporia mesophila TaxID=566012 RepID=A0ABP6Z7U8_9ACTN